MTEKDADYAVSFAIPADTTDVHMIYELRLYTFSDENVITGYGAGIDQYFDNVFVPWERVSCKE
jgi:4-hydroxyphenylacetate 3-monooxygenase/4-hydroxybutyryl-CoA dehydratase/vinylacetyl-CoA-Delta-isomerase